MQQGPFTDGGDRTEPAGNRAQSCFCIREYSHAWAQDCVSSLAPRTSMDGKIPAADSSAQARTRHRQWAEEYTVLTGGLLSQRVLYEAFRTR